jgi:hypothetical protein
VIAQQRLVLLLITLLLAEVQASDEGSRALEWEIDRTKW